MGYGDNVIPSEVGRTGLGGGYYGSPSFSGSGKPSKKKEEGCCAACVIYAGMSGSVNGGEVEQLEVLREYRDNVLMQDEIGRRFVDWYYNGGGEKMAEFVRGRGKFLVPIIKKGLDFIVEDYKRRRT